MSSPAGWHPDPVPAPPGQAPQLRYWDGTRWTEHVAPAQQAQQAQPTQPYQAQRPTQPTDQSQPGPYGGTYGASPYAAQQPYSGQPYGAQPYGNQPYGTKAAPTTPDGVRLAGWWQRVLATILDGIVLGIIGAIVTLPWLRDVFHAYTDWFDEVMRTTDSSTSTIDTTSLQREIQGPIAIIGAISLALGFVYHVGFLMWKQATPGKLVVGLRVRLRERPGPMPIGTVLVRWLAQFGVGIIGLVPYVGTLSSLYSLLDSLWPLWDDKKQAIHDKAAKTNVVRTR